MQEFFFSSSLEVERNTKIKSVLPFPSALGRIFRISTRKVALNKNYIGKKLQGNGDKLKLEYTLFS